MGILKAGGVFVPLDSQCPSERLAFMLDDTEAAIVITDSKLSQRIRASDTPVVCMDLEGETIASNSGGNLGIEVAGQDLSYIIYTSGSTGQPKGVMITHDNLASAYCAWDNAFEFSEGCNTFLQTANFTFDVFVADVVRSLCFGNKLVLCSNEILVDPKRLYRLMVQEKVDTADFVPAILRSLIEYLEGTSQRLDFMRLLICGSDVWLAGEYGKFKGFLDEEARLVNAYGLTEATIDSTYFEGLVTELGKGQILPIGRPFSNTEVYVLDEHLNVCPPGIGGQLYLGGAGISRGYLNLPELTSEKFISNPFSQDSSKKIV